MQYMDKPDNIAALHRRQFDWIPESIYREIGHFNVFRLEPYAGDRSNLYEVFQPGGMHVFDLSQEQVTRVSGYYVRMFEEINSNYIYKYDVLRNLVFEVLHFAMKQTPRRGV